MSQKSGNALSCRFGICCRNNLSVEEGLLRCPRLEHGTLMMHDSHPNDIEPMDPDERCDAVYGPYHIGLEDEKSAESALFFDPFWLPTFTLGAAAIRYCRRKAQTGPS